MLKQRNQRPTVPDKEISKLADELADKPYGDDKKPDDDPLIRTSITLPRSMLTRLEDQALHNKRSGSELKSVSAIIRDAVERLSIK